MVSLGLLLDLSCIIDEVKGFKVVKTVIEW